MAEETKQKIKTARGEVQAGRRERRREMHIIR